jgi:flagellar basal-body rod modification protein FlgD
MAVSATAAAGSTPTSNLSLQDFLRILTSQLSNQDPLKPLDNQEFVTQVAQFSTLEQSRQLNEKIDQLLSVQSVTSSVGLLGKTVDIDLSGSTVTGQVTAISYASGDPRVTVTTTSGAFQAGITLAQIVTVR